MNETLFEAFLYTALTPKFDSLLDVIKIEIPEEEYNGSSNITQYAMPFGLSSDFVDNNPMVIKINNCCMKNTKGLIHGNLEVNIFKILELQQKLVPIFLKTSGFNGMVYMRNWNVKRQGIESTFNAEFVTTTILKPFEELNFQATQGVTASVPSSSIKSDSVNIVGK